MKIMGHRGAKGELPENTLIGFQRALDLKLEAVELDIHLSDDGRLAVIHDDTVDRTTNGSGRVGDLSWQELQVLNAGEGQRIPELNEVLELLQNIEVQIEVKDGKTLPELKKLLSNLPKAQQDLLTIISFHHSWLLEIKKGLPQIKTACLLYGRPLNPVQIAKACGANGISFNIGFIDEDLRKQTRDAGLTLTGWNANNKLDFQKMKQLELDYIGTDFPTEILTF